MNKLIVASNNKHKVQEINQILHLENLEILDLSSFPNIGEIIEDGLTLEANALKKAITVFNETGITSIADDTGLMVDYLLGEPGVFSARYSGENVSYEDNNRKLLYELNGVPTRRRTARFKCCIAVVNEKIQRTVEAAIEGKILFAPKGKNGFGYDPLFLPDGFSKSYAELSDIEKNKISHRGKALQLAREVLINEFNF